MVVFISLMFKFWFAIDFSAVFQIIKQTMQTNRLSPLWLVLLIIYPFVNALTIIISYRYQLNQANLFVKTTKWYQFAFICLLINAITPFAIGSQPYAIYWLTKQGLTPKQASAIVGTTMVFNPLIQVIITWPSFFILLGDYPIFQSDPGWFGAFWLVVFGLIIDLIGTLFWFAIGFSRHFHYWINLVINFSKQLLKLPTKTKIQIKNEFVTNASFKTHFVQCAKDYRFALILIICALISNFYYYGLLIISFNWLQPDHHLRPNWLFNLINVATTANNFSPIPGAEGGLQTTLLFLIIPGAKIQNPDWDAQQIKVLLDGAILIWRTFSFYFPAALGMVAFFIALVQNTYEHHQFKQSKWVPLNLSILLIIDQNDDHFDQIENNLKTIINQYHNHLQALEIVLIYQAPWIQIKVANLSAALKPNRIKINSYQVDPRANWNQIIKIASQNQWINHQYLYLYPPKPINLNLSIFPIINQSNCQSTLWCFKNPRSHYKLKWSPKKSPLMTTISPFNFVIQTSLLNNFQPCVANEQLQWQHYYNHLSTTTKQIKVIKQPVGFYD